jgi:adenylate kinase family enzyme
VLRDRLNDEYAPRFVLDGYPPTKDQADHLRALLREIKFPASVIRLIFVNHD